MASILCVDDDATVLHALRTLLEQNLGGSYTVELAESGNEALEICKEIQQDGRELSVVVSDYIMPGMRGDELLIHLHQMSPATIKIMLTGQSDLQGVKRSINEANLYRFLEKPFDNTDLTLTIKAALRSFSREKEQGGLIDHLIKTNDELSTLLEASTAELAALKRQMAKPDSHRL